MIPKSSQVFCRSSKLEVDRSLTKIVTGYKDERDQDGKKVMILKDRTKPVTLRHLLTHTAGLAYYWNQ